MRITVFFKTFNNPSRSAIIKKNILGSFIIKLLSILSSMLLIPLTLGLLTSEKYGIWITIHSVVTWFNMMDIGLGNGFRNKFAESVASGKIDIAKSYVENIYSLTTIISIFFIAIYTLIHPILDWNTLLNVSTEFNENISQIVWIVFFLFSIQLILKNISTILLSLQKTALNSTIYLITNLISLLNIYFLKYCGEPNLQKISIIYMTSPIFVFFIFTIIVFNKELSIYKPTKISIDKKYFHSMKNLGLKFFLIQITSIVLFTSGNFIVAHTVGSKNVTQYHITNRLFSSAIMMFNIILAPFWSAYTEAYIKNDFAWIKQAQIKLKKLWILFFFMILLLLFLTPFIYEIWVGKNTSIPFTLSLQFAIYSLLMSWSGIYSQFLNGIGKIKLQLYIAVFQCIFNIPFAIILSKYLNFGTEGVVMATNINLAISAIVLPIQANKICNKNATGIWLK